MALACQLYRDTTVVIILVFLTNLYTFQAPFLQSLNGIFRALVVSNNDKPMALLPHPDRPPLPEDNWKRCKIGEALSETNLTALCENPIPRCRELNVVLLCWLLC